MPHLTEAELKLQKKYEELRKKKEQQKLQKSSAQGASTSGGTLEKAKAALAKKVSATAKPAPTASAAPSTSKKPADPLAAAKQALEAKKRAGGGLKRPAQKRPTVQRVAKPKEADNREPEAGSSPVTEAGNQDQTGSNVDAASISTAWDWEQQDTNRHRSENVQPPQQHDSRTRDCTIFVGDLPPFYDRAEVHELFSNYGSVEEAKVFKDSCYAFVTFDSIKTAQQVLDRFVKMPLTAHGHTLRINQAYGQMPEWKKGPTIPHERRPTRPITAPSKVVEARKYGDQLAEQLLRAGAHGLDFSAKAQPRQLVTYDDL